MTDPFEFDDGAYVLGALSPAERDAFEQHLATCADCQARVADVSPVATLLAGAGITAEDVLGTDEATDPLPDLVLAGLLRSVRTERRRRRWLIGGLAAVAAACLVALVVVIAWPSSSSSPEPFAQRDFTAVAASPVRADATLTAKSWGTAIDLHCHYLPGKVDKAFGYDLVAVGPRGITEQLGSWKLPPDKDIDYSTGTSLSPGQIRKLTITLPDGTPVLSLKL